MALKNLMVRIGADISNMQRGMRQAQSSMDGFSRSVSRSTRAIGATLASIGAGVGIKSVVSDAMAMEVSLEQVNRMMGKSAQEFVNWAESSAGAFNFSKKQAIEYGGVFSNLISTFAKDTKQIQGYTQSLLEANAVVASKTGRTIDDVNERIRSGMLGNTESIEDLGIFVGISMIESTEAFRRFAGDRSWQQLDFQTQQTIRYFAILEQAATKYGATVSGNTSSQTAQLVAQLNNLKLAIGQAFLPIWQTVLPALSAMVGWLVKAANTVAQFMQVLFGKTPKKEASNVAKGASNVASAVGGVGDAYKGAGKAAKKAAKDQKGFLASFDEINSVADQTNADDATGGSGGSGAGGGAGAGGIDTSAIPVFSEIGDAAFKMSERIRAFATSVREFFGGIKDVIVNNKDIIIAALSGIAAALLVVFAPAIFAAVVSAFETLYIMALYALGGIKAALAFLLTPIALIAAGIALLVAAFVYFYRTNESFKGFVDGILQKIADAAIWLWKNALVPLGEYLAGGLKKAWEGITTAAQWFWKNVMVPLGDFLKKFYDSVLVPLGKVIGEALVLAFKGASEIATAFWKTVMVPLGTFLGTVLKGTLDTLIIVFKSLWENVLVPFGRFLSDTLGVQWKDLGTAITIIWDKVLKPLAIFIGGIFKDVFISVFASIGEIIAGVQVVFQGLIKFIQGVFEGDWKKAWQGVADVFKGIWDTLVATAKTPLNAIIAMINRVIGAMNSLNIDIPDWMPGDLGGKSFGVNIPKIPALAKGGITNGPTLAMIGDNIGGQEVVSPLDDLKGMIADVVSTALQYGGNQQPSGDIVLSIDGNAFARVTNPYFSKETKRIGSSLIRTK